MTASQHYCKSLRYGFRFLHTRQSTDHGEKHPPFHEGEFLLRVNEYNLKKDKEETFHSEGVRERVLVGTNHLDRRTIGKMIYTLEA